jgi:Putative adhesin
VRSTPLLLLVLLIVGCSEQAPYVTTVGLLNPGATMSIRSVGGTISAFAPAAGQPRNRFTISATAEKGKPQTAPPKLRAGRDGLTVGVLQPVGSLLVRVPDGVALDIDSKSGDVHVTNITGSVRVRADKGDVQIMVRSYAQAAVGDGNLSSTMGSIDWPGTLHYSIGHGDAEVWVNENAKFHVRLHTDNGMLFTDFDLRGTSEGRSETIDGDINGGGSRSIDIETQAGAIRLLKLHPQA